MASKQPRKTTFQPEHTIRPIYTGGAVAVDDGARILATTLGEDVVLTHPSNGKHLTQIEGDGESVSTLLLTPSGSHLIICSRSLSMRIYSLQREQQDGSVSASLLRTLKPHATPVSVLAVDRTSTLVATGGTDGIVKVWDIVGGYLTHTFHGPSVLVSALHFFEMTGDPSDRPSSRKGKKNSKNAAKAQEEAGAGEETTTAFRLASGAQDGKIRIWNLHTRSCTASLDSHVSEIQGLDYSPQQNAIVSGSRDKTVIWWDAKSWKVRKLVPSFEGIEVVGFIEDGSLTFSAGANGALRIWDSNSGRELTAHSEPKSDEEAIVSGIYRPQLPFLMLVQADYTLCIFDIPSQSDLLVAKVLEPAQRISGSHDDIIDLAYLLPDKSIMALATNSEDIRIVSAVASDATLVEDGSIGRTDFVGQDIALLKGHEEIVIALDVDWSGNWIATGAKDNTARLWRIGPEKGSYVQWAVFTGHAESLGAVALPKHAPADTTAAKADPLSHPPAFLITGSQDQTIKKWDIPRTRQQEKKSHVRAVFTRKAHEKDINALNVHHAGQLFASASQDKTVKIWSTEEGEVQGILRGHKRGVWSVQFAPAHLPTLQGNDGPVTSKGVVLTGSADKSIKLWSLNDYTCIRTFEGHSNSVLKVAWLVPPAGDNKQKRPIQFASAGGDGLVKVWDANSGETECTLDNHEDRVWALAVHPGTNTIVSGSGDSSVTFWKDTSAETQAAASQAAAQLIEQEQELQNHIHAGSYREAIVLALQLGHPGRLLNLFTSVTSTSPPETGSLSGLKAVDQVLAQLSDEQIFSLLLRLRDWNTNARTAPVAQRILQALIRLHPASRLSRLSIKGAQGQKSLRDVLHGLRVYTERHYKRMDELIDESYLVEYTLREMDTLVPTIAEEDVLMNEVVEV